MSSESIPPEDEASNVPPYVYVADVLPEAVTWLWPSYVPLGKVTIIEGDPDLGKSTVALDIAARVSTGMPMPFDTATRPPAGVVLLSAEDGIADTIRPRLEAAGADLNRVAAFPLDALPSIPQDLGRIEQAVIDSAAQLVIVDPLMAFLGDKIDSWKDQHVRRALAPLAALAERTGAAVVVVRHLKKGGESNAKYRGGGSIGILGAARSAMLVAPDPDDEDGKVFAPVKHNLCARPPALTFRLVAAGPTVRVEWLAQVDHRAGDLLQAQAALGEERGALGEAKSYLKQLLAAGPVAFRTVEREARAAGVADRTLDRAKAALGVRSRKLPSGWVWLLPTQERQSESDGGVGALGALGETRGECSSCGEASRLGADGRCAEGFGCGSDVALGNGEQSSGVTVGGQRKDPGLDDWNAL